MNKNDLFFECYKFILKELFIKSQSPIENFIHIAYDSFEINWSVWKITQAFKNIKFFLIIPIYMLTSRKDNNYFK